MNLNNLSQSLKQYSWLIITVVLITVLLTLALISLTSKTTKLGGQTLEKPNLEVLINKTQSLQTQNISLPKSYPVSLPVYTASYNQNLAQTAPQISTKLGFTNPPADVTDASSGKGQLYTTDNNDALLIYPNNLTYQRVVNNPADNNFGSIENDKKEALNLISSLGLSTSFAAKSTVTYLKLNDDFLTETQNPSEASLLKVTFYYQISNLPVYNPKNAVSATFNKAGQITNLTYFNLPLGPTNGTYTLITPQQAIQTLQNGNASLIGITTPNNYTIPPQAISNANIQAAQLAYYLAPNSQSIQPVWILNGTGDGISLSYAVPAIDPKFFTQP